MKDDWKICNCADCGKELLGESMIGKFSKKSPMPMVEGRVNERPYCYICLPAAKYKDEMRKKRSVIRNFDS